MRILIVEDDHRIASNISAFFKDKSNFITQIAPTFEEAEYLFSTESYDGIILDWMLPDGDGLELLDLLRSRQITTPVIVLTAKSQTEDKVAGLEYGADDYLTKPFALEELLARIKTIIRRKELFSAAPLIAAGDLKINTNTRTVYIKEQQINLAPREYELLEYLVLKQGIALTRQDLLDHVWGEKLTRFPIQ
ncbi:response regulator transcription factor [Candidatus Daviesbacteria bacterium]|nr:response regulator transcription factor [Candidatus Daviesbacteria bacterium]